MYTGNKYNARVVGFPYKQMYINDNDYDTCPILQNISFHTFHKFCNRASNVCSTMSGCFQYERTNLDTQMSKISRATRMSMSLD